MKFCSRSTELPKLSTKALPLLIDIMLCHLWMILLINHLNDSIKYLSHSLLHWIQFMWRHFVNLCDVISLIYVTSFRNFFFSESNLRCRLSLDRPWVRACSLGICKMEASSGGYNIIFTCAAAAMPHDIEWPFSHNTSFCHKAYKIQLLKQFQHFWQHLIVSFLKV